MSKITVETEAGTIAALLRVIRSTARQARVTIESHDRGDRWSLETAIQLHPHDFRADAREVLDIQAELEVALEAVGFTFAEPTTWRASDVHIQTLDVQGSRDDGATVQIHAFVPYTEPAEIPVAAGGEK